MPEFSIICPVFNREHLIQSAIQSVVNQIFIDWELIIVDDGSTDNTKVVVDKFLNDNRIKYLYQTNKGQSYARNLGIKIATGNYICFLDSDDLYFENHLNVFNDAIYASFYNNEILCSNWIINNGKSEQSKNLSNGISTNKIDLVLHNDISINNLCIPTSFLIEYKFEEKYKFFEDTHLLVRIILKTNLILLNDVTVTINNHSQRGTYTIYDEKNSIDKINNNIAAIKDLFEKHGNEIIEITQKPYLESYLVSEKYIHHANGALVYGHPILSLQLIFKAIVSDNGLIHRKLYARYFLKYPAFSIFLYLKRILCDGKAMLK